MILLRFRVSTKTIEGVVDVASKVTQTAMGINAIRSGIQLKRSIERQRRIAVTLRKAQSVAEISTGVARAISVLASSGK